MRILMVEDDQNLCRAVSDQLKQAGYDMDVCHDADDAAFYIAEGAYDLVLLDRMLPGCDGLTLLKKWRKKKLTCPVLMLTAMGGMDDKVEGLDAGADDYLSKPFDIRELLARIRVLLRRKGDLMLEPDTVWGDCKLSQESFSFTGPYGTVRLSKKETLLLNEFLKNPGRTLTREFLFAKFWGPDSETEECILDSYISFLRKRLTAVGSRLSIVTVRGRGYRLEDRE
ncbi:MAG: response regulator transcription factor [Oscillospiraceae bacterium]|nr:response regulator transcription factor [Oscillospiraceae bacterium]